MECEREGENGKPAEGRKFEGENSRKRKTVTAGRWEKGRWIGVTGGRERTRGRNVPVSGRVGTTKSAGRTRVRIAKRTKLGVVESSSLPHGRGITDEEIYDSLGIFIFCACQWSTDGSSRDIKKDNEISI